MNDMHDIFSKTLGDILTDFQVTTTAMPMHEPTAAPQRASKPKRVKTQAKATNTSKKPANSPKIDLNTEDNKDFDLRQAVIYAEILRPKFKDEEF